MKKFNTGAGRDEIVSIIAVGAPGEEQDEWTKALSTSPNETKNEVGDNRIVDPGSLFEPFFDQHEIWPHCGKHVASPDIHYRRLRNERTLNQFLINSVASQDGIIEG
jgi:hypothetical protein